MAFAFPPVLVAMAKDRRLRPTDLSVYIVAAQHLDFVRYRPLKVTGLALACGLTKGHVSRSVRRLVQTGYLDVQRQPVPPKAGGGQLPALFRLPYSLEPPPEPPENARLTPTAGPPPSRPAA